MTTHNPWRWAAQPNNETAELGFTGILHRDGGCEGASGPKGWHRRYAGAWERNHGEHCTASACKAAESAIVIVVPTAGTIIDGVIQAFPDLLEADKAEAHELANQMVADLHKALGML